MDFIISESVYVGFNPGSNVVAYRTECQFYRAAYRFLFIADCEMLLHCPPRGMRGASSILWNPLSEVITL